MSSPLHWNNLFTQVEEHVGESREVAYLIAPFITTSVFQELTASLQGKQVIVITSWGSDHLLAGVSSPELYPVIEKQNWRLFINDRLHMKLYSADLESALVGSANITQSALKDTERGNHELLAHLEPLSESDRNRVYQLQDASTLVTDEIHQTYVDWLAKQTPLPRSKPETIYKKPAEEQFLTSRFPITTTPEMLWQIMNGQIEADHRLRRGAEHDLAVYPANVKASKEVFKKELARLFFQQPFVARLAQDITHEGMQFGLMKQWIRRHCRDVPVPFAGELSVIIQHIMQWFKALDPETYDVYVPGRHSEFLRRLK